MFQCISRVQFERRLAELCVDSGVMEFPRREQDRHILWKNILVGLDPAARFTEKEIDERIQHWLSRCRTISRDHVNIRRQLVDQGYITRTPDGSVYQCAAAGPSREYFDADVENVNCDTIIHNRQVIRTHKRRDFLKKRFQ